MWTIINNCDKQLTVKSVVREKVDDNYKEYVIANVEFDQYHLELSSINGEISTQKQHNTLTCAQLMQYAFEIKNEDRNLTM